MDDAVSQLQLDVVRDEREFASMSSEWDRALAASRSDGPCLTHDWLSGWWRWFGQGARLEIITCREGRGGALVGVLPLYVREKSRVVVVQLAALMGDTGVGSVGLSAFALPEAEDAVFELFSRFLGGPDPGWDVLDLRFMAPGDRFRSALESGPPSLDRSGAEVCPVIALPPDFDTYLAGLSKHWRHETRRARRRVTEEGVEPELITRADALPQAADDFLRLHELRMRDKLGSYALSPEARGFTRDRMSHLLATGQLRLLFLRSGEGRVAGLYQLRHGDTLYAVQSGFDEAAAADKVQRAMWAEAIEQAIAEGCTQLNMMLGDQRYKFHWGVTEVRQLHALRVYASTPTGRTVRARDLFRERRRARTGSVSAAATIAPQSHPVQPSVVTREMEVMDESPVR